MAVVCLVAQGLGLAHVGFSRHAICPEHGELIEVTAQAQPGGVLRSADSLERPGLTRPSAYRLSGVEDHCALANLLRQVRTSPGLTSLVVGTPAEERIPAARWAARAERGLFRLAPKQSPPV
jgi:hypothetical protein